MPIYRGEGGSGDAVADSASEALLIRALVADADADATAAAASASAAATSASAASSSASSASSSASAATTSATNAANSVASINLANITITGGSITGITDIAVADGGTGASTASDARTNLGLGTIATQAASSVAITGGSINGTTVGATTASTGAFTTLAASGATTLSSTLGVTGVATFSAGTVSAPAITTTGDTNTGIFFPAADTIAFTEGGVESVRINSSGAVCIGTTSGGGKVNIQNAQEGQLHLFYDTTYSWRQGPNSGGSYVIYRNIDSVGVYLAWGGTSWTSNSDERLKTNLKPIENAVEKVSTLRTVTGRYKTDSENTSRAFLIAQDVQAVLPEAVNVQQDEQNTLGLQYSDVIPLLVAAIKELKAEVDTLKAQINAA